MDSADSSDPGEGLSDAAELAFGVLDPEAAGVDLSGGVPEGFPELNSSSMDFCRAFLASLPSPRGLGILTGEPPMLTNTLEFPTDFFTGGLGPETVADRASGGSERTGERRALGGDGGLVREGGEDAEDCEVPPRTKPLPLNGIIFRMSCDPEPRTQRNPSTTVGC